MKIQSKTPFYGSNNYKKSLENEDSEDGYISPQDISIKDEKIWDPTDEEILSYALKLGYDIEKDPDELFEVAYYYMKYPLPEGWKRGIMKNTKELVYINFMSGEIEVSTEIEEMAHQMYLEKKSEMNKKNASIFKKTPEKKETTTVVPRKKIPPLNPLQKSNNSTGIKSLPGIKDSNTKANKNNNDLQYSDKKNNLDLFKNENENLIKLNNNIDKFLEKSLNEKDYKDLHINNNKNKEDINETKNGNIKNSEKELKLNDENKKQNYEFLLNLGGADEEENEELEDDEEEEDKEEKDDKGDKYGIEEKEDSFLKQMLKREKEIEQLRKEKEKDIENALNKNENLKNLIDIKKIKCESEGVEEKQENKEKLIDNNKNFENIQLFKEKKEYLKKKLEELKDYKNEIKIIYKDKKSEFEKEKKEKQNFFDNKLKEEINKCKNKLEKQYKEKLELYEKQLINKKGKEEKRYKDELINNIKSKKEEDKEIIKKREQKEKEELNHKKMEILKEIENLKKLKIINDSNLSQKKINLQKNILLLEEKKNIEKKNKTKKTEIEIKNIENQLEKDFQQTKKNMAKNSLTISFMPKKLNNLEDTIYNSSLLNDIQKVLDEEYEMNCKAFEQELENKKLKEIDKYINLMTNEKNEQISFFKSEMSSIEKDYYKSISNIRNNFQQNKANNEKNLNLKFEQTLKGYEQTKKEIYEQNQQLMKHINDNLHKLLIGNYTLNQTEYKLDEFLVNLKDKYLLMYQRNKNNFDMYENDYIFKTQFIKYLLDIINYINKLFINIKTDRKKDEKKEENKNNQNNIDNQNNDQKMAENLLIYCYEKINEYQKKYKKVKNSSIFKFMNGNLMKSQSFDNSCINEFDEINKTILFEASSRRKILKDNEINENIEKNINIKDKINYNNENSTNNEINSKAENIYNKNNNNLELTYLIIQQENNFIVPKIPENILSNLNEDILILYSDIVSFLENEYNKIIQINQIAKENNNKKNINFNLNLIILDKIKSFAEESFNYLISNYQKNDQYLNIKKKLRLILSHIEEYRNNFNLDKYISKIKQNNIIEEEADIVNQMPINNANLARNNSNYNNYINKKEDIKNNFGSKKYSSVIEGIKEKEKKQQEERDGNLKKSIKMNYYKDNLNGRFNNFYRQYSSNSLVDKITNPFLYQFFNYKKNKYELDKSLGKFSIP